MNITEFLSPDDVCVGLAATDKARLLHDLAERAAPRVNLDAGLIANELTKRESLGSTGVGHGVGLPHARLANLDRPFGLLARLKRPIEFDAIDGVPVDVVFLLLLPAGAQGEHINALAAVARQLRGAERLAALRKAHDASALFAAATA